MKKKLLLMIALIGSITSWANEIDPNNPNLLSQGFNLLSGTEVEGNTLKYTASYSGGGWVFEDYYGVNLKELGYGGVSIEYEKADFQSNDNRFVSVSVTYYCEHIPGQGTDYSCQFLQESIQPSGKLTIKFKDLPVSSISVMTGWSNGNSEASPQNPVYITIKSADLIPLSEMPYAAPQTNTAVVSFEDFDEGFEFNDYAHYPMLEFGLPWVDHKVSVESDPAGINGKSLKCVPSASTMASIFDISFPEGKTVAHITGISFDVYWESYPDLSQDDDVENDPILLYIGDTSLDLGWGVGFLNDQSVYFKGNPVEKVGVTGSWYTNTVLIDDIFDKKINTAIGQGYHDYRPGSQYSLYDADINRVKALNKIWFGIGFGNSAVANGNIVYYLDNIEFLFKDSVEIPPVDTIPPLVIEIDPNNPDLLSQGFNSLLGAKAEGNTLKYTAPYGGGGWIFEDYYGVNLKELGYGGVTIEYEKADFQANDNRFVSLGVTYYCEHVPGQGTDYSCQFLQESILPSGKLTIKFKDLPVSSIFVMTGWPNGNSEASPQNPVYITIKSANLIPVSEIPHAAPQTNTTTISFEDFDEGFEFNDYAHYAMHEWGFLGINNKVLVKSAPTGINEKSLKCIPDNSLMASIFDVNFPEGKTVADLVGISFDAYWESYPDLSRNDDVENVPILLYIGNTSLDLGWGVGFMNDQSVYFKGNPIEKVGVTGGWHTNTVLIDDIFNKGINTAINQGYYDYRPGSHYYLYNPNINKVKALNKIRFGIGFGNYSAADGNIVYYLDNVEFLFKEDNVVIAPIDSITTTISWAPITDAAFYCLTIYKNSNRTEPVYVACFDAEGYQLGEERLRNSEEGFNHVIKNLNNNTFYYYDLAAYNGENEVFTQTRGFFTSDGITSVKVSQSSTLSVYALDHTILIKNAGEDNISVYNTTGQIVANVRAAGLITAVKVPSKGVYIVNVGGKVQKVLVK